MAEREEAWQEQMSTPVWLGFTAFGFAPVIGPAVHCAVNFRDGYYKTALCDAVCVGIDVFALGAASTSRGAAATARAANKQKWLKPAARAVKSVKEARKQAKLAGEAAKVALKTATVAKAVQTTATVLNVGKAVAKMPPYKVFGEACPSTLANVEVPGALPAPCPLTAEESDGTAFIPFAKQPRRTLAESNFLRFYKAMPRQPTKAVLRGHLEEHVKTTFDKCLAHFAWSFWSDCLGEAAARLWTFNEPAHYKAINNALMTDNAALLRMWAPLIRVLNNYMVGFVLRCAITTRRKSWLKKAEALALKVGSTYRLGMYCGTSKCVSCPNWTDFPEAVGGTEVRWEFKIPSHCFQACDIEQASIFRNEREVLLVPYTPVTIDRFYDSGGVLTIYASLPKDGKALRDDLETIMA